MAPKELELIKIVLKKILWAFNIKLRSHYKIKDLLKNLPFYTSEIKQSKRKNKNFTNNRFLSEVSLKKL